MKRRAFVIFTLMIAGEAVFLLPFVLPRIFRPTFLTVFHLTNLELGTAFSVYGVIAMFSYFLGGPIADRFSAKGLLIISLLLSSLAGLHLYSIPDYQGMNWLYAFWGVSTILLFWAAFIKITRIYGGDTQGLAFGMIDSGRGFFAAILATGSIYVFSLFLPADPALVKEADLTTALRAVILIFSGFGCLSAGLIALALRGKENGNTLYSSISIPNLLAVVRRKSLWYQAFIVLCAYTGYKCTDDFSLYAVDVLGYDDVQAATVGTISFWARGVGALLAGVLGDRFKMTRVLTICFAIMTASSLLLTVEAVAVVPAFTALNLAVGSTAIYGLRGLYYSVFNISNIPLALTGSAVGLVAVVGYAPEIFMGPLMGVVLDSSPGPLGHYQLFTILALFGVGGIAATYLFDKEVTRLHFEHPSSSATTE